VAIWTTHKNRSFRPGNPSFPRVLVQQEAANVGVACAEPLPLVRLQDYDGSFQKTVGLFARELERKSVHPPHYKPGLKLCSLDLRGKFLLFERDTFDPVTLVASGFNAGLDQAENRDPSFEQGAAGYGKRIGGSFADQVSFKFFRNFAYHSIFSEDPRYYRVGYGNNGRRLLHAVNHAFLAHRDNGHRMFNVSEWLGTVSVIALSNVYHPGNERGFAPAAIQVGYNIVEDAGFNVLREFWPEMARKFRLPFRVETTGNEYEANPSIK